MRVGDGVRVIVRVGEAVTVSVRVGDAVRVAVGVLVDVACTSASIGFTVAD